MHLNRIHLLAAVWVIAFPVYAAPSDAGDKPEPEASVRGLAPAQLATIRAIGRNVLVAKKSATDDPADREQISQLRAAVNTLVAAELDAGNRASITAQNGEAPVLPQAMLAAERRDTARADARARAEQVRRHGDLLASRALAGDPGTTSAGLPVAGQRAQLFERLAQKLDAALADGAPDRMARLIDLQSQLAPGNARLNEAPPLATPTLQAMPSTSATPIRAVSASEAKPRSTPVKARPRKPKAK